LSQVNQKTSEIAVVHSKQAQRHSLNSTALTCCEKHSNSCLLHANICLPIVEKIQTDYYEALTSCEKQFF